MPKNALDITASAQTGRGPNYGQLKAADSILPAGMSIPANAEVSGQPTTEFNAPAPKADNDTSIRMVDVQNIGEEVKLGHLSSHDAREFVEAAVTRHLISQETADAILNDIPHPEAKLPEDDEDEDASKKDDAALEYFFLADNDPGVKSALVVASGAGLGFFFHRHHGLHRSPKEREKLEAKEKGEAPKEKGEIAKAKDGVKDTEVGVREGEVAARDAAGLAKGGKELEVAAHEMEGLSKGARSLGELKALGGALELGGHAKRLARGTVVWTAVEAAAVGTITYLLVRNATSSEERAKAAGLHMGYADLLSEDARAAVSRGDYLGAVKEFGKDLWEGGKQLVNTGIEAGKFAWNDPKAAVNKVVDVGSEAKDIAVLGERVLEHAEFRAPIMNMMGHLLDKDKTAATQDFLALKAAVDAPTTTADMKADVMKLTGIVLNTAGGLTQSPQPGGGNRKVALGDQPGFGG